MIKYEVIKISKDYVDPFFSNKPYKWIQIYLENREDYNSHFMQHYIKKYYSDIDLCKFDSENIIIMRIFAYDLQELINNQTVNLYNIKLTEANTGENEVTQIITDLHLENSPEVRKKLQEIVTSKKPPKEKSNLLFDIRLSDFIKKLNKIETNNPDYLEIIDNLCSLEFTNIINSSKIPNLLKIYRIFLETVNANGKVNKLKTLTSLMKNNNIYAQSLLDDNIEFVDDIIVYLTVVQNKKPTYITLLQERNEKCESEDIDLIIPDYEVVEELKSDFLQSIEEQIEKIHAECEGESNANY